MIIINVGQEMETIFYGEKTYICIRGVVATFKVNVINLKIRFKIPYCFDQWHYNEPREMALNSPIITGPDIFPFLLPQSRITHF